MSGEEEDEKAWVWHASDGVDVRMMHDCIVVSLAGEMRVFECLQKAPPRAVSMVLAAAGFEGGFGGSEIEIDDDEVEERGLVYHRGFQVDAGKLADVEMAIRTALAGDKGGFTPVLAALGGFHRGTYFAFEHVWAAAGMPQLHTRHPNLIRGGGGSGAPGSIEEVAWGDSRFALASTSAGFEPPKGSEG